MRKIILPVAIFLITGLNAIGQQVPSYNQFFFNRALYNPSFIGQSGYTEANVNHRQQWVGIEGAPVTTNVNIQAPLSDKLALGLILYSDKLGLISTYETTAGLSYNVRLGHSSRLSFGLTAGVGRNDIEFVNNDPAYTNALDKSFYFSGQFGVNLEMDRLTIGFALPQLMESQFSQEENFEEIGLEATRLTFSSISYRFDIGPKITLEPTVFYQSDDKTIDQLGGLAALTYNNVFWIGGGYREEQGANGFVGFNINEFIKVGYAYEFAPAAVSTELSNGTHEFQIGIRLGKSNKRKPKTIVNNDVQPTPDIAKSTTEQVEDDEEEIISEELETKAIERAPNEKKEKEIEQEEYLNEPEVEEPEPSPEPIEKERVVKPGELAPGYYVVVGAYQSKMNAESYARKVRSSGYNVSIGLNPETGLNYVYIKQTQDFDSAAKVRDSIRKIYEFEFREAWILNIK